jgi:dUTP pyrophosphatase
MSDSTDESPTVRVSRTGEIDVPLPAYQTPGAAGLDLRAALAEPVVVPPLGRVRVPTGLRLAIPSGYEGQVRPRSGLAAKEGITVLNAPGTIDSDYRGPVEVLLVNLSDKPVTLSPQDRIAQLVIAKVAQASLVWVDTLDDTVRGAGGFGSTGRA